MLVPNFNLKNHFNFLFQICPKGNFRSKIVKVSMITEFATLESAERPTSSLNRQFEVLVQNCPKRVFLLKDRISEHHHQKLDIQISIGTKFKTKSTIVIFHTNFAQKGYFQP